MDGQGHMAIRIGTSEAGGTFDTQGAAIAELINAGGGPDTAITAESNDASVGNARRLEAGELEFGFMASNWIGRAFNAEPPFDRRIALRMATPANAGPLFFVARAGSGIRYIGDMIGRRVSIGPATSGMTQHVHTIFDVLGISFDDFTPVHLGFADGADALAAGEIDAQFQCPIPNAVMTALSRRADVRVLEYEAGQIDRLIDRVPFYRRIVMPKDAFRGVEEDTEQVAVLNVIVTHARVPDEVVRGFVRTVVSNTAALAEANPLFRGLDALFEPLRGDGAAALEMGGVPLHPGALAAYRDAGYLA